MLIAPYEAQSEIPPEVPVVSAEIIERRILMIRGRKVMLDADLAELYGVETFNLNKAVKRNIDRFPIDFMFQLTKEEAAGLRFQIGISKSNGSGGRRYLPYVFTEQGIAMLSSILKSKRAVQVNILIMRVFVKLRELMASHQELARRIEELERKYGVHDETINDIFKAIRELLAPQEEKKEEKPMGFLSG